MFFCTNTSAEYYSDRSALLFLPMQSLMIINIQAETHPEVYAYANKRKHEPGTPEFKEAIFTPLKLNAECVLCRVAIVDEPGRFRKLTSMIRARNINILGTCGSTIINRGVIELYLDFSGATCEADAFIRELDRLKNEGTVLDYSMPEPLTEVCNVGIFKDALSSARIMPSPSNPSIAQLRIGRDIIDFLDVNWIPLEKQDPITSKAVVSTYLRFPMLVSALLPPHQKLCRIKVPVKDSPGALDEVLVKLQDLATIYASTLTTVAGVSGSWNAFVFPFDGATHDDVENTLNNIGSKWIDKTRKIEVEEITR